MRMLKHNGDIAWRPQHGGHSSPETLASRISPPYRHTQLRIATQRAANKPTHLLVKADNATRPPIYTCMYIYNIEGLPLYMIKRPTVHNKASYYI